MEFTDKKKFYDKMEEMARSFDRNITTNEVDYSFRMLKDYPFWAVDRAIDKAIKDRDGTDLYLARSLLSIPEIRAAADEVLLKETPEIKIGCKECNYTGFILTTPRDAEGRVTGQPQARRCECFKAVLAAKKRKKSKK
jgi:hypothetical protein